MDRLRTKELREYTSSRRYRLVNNRFHKSAEMTVQAVFRAPGEKKFEVVAESGSKVIRDKVLHRMLESELEAADGPARRNTQITPDNYHFELAGSSTDRGRPAYVFEVTPKTPNKFLFRGRVWLDAEDYAITRIEGSPAKNPSVWIRSTRFVHTYQKVGPFWLAASNVSDSESLIFGSTRVEIEYGDYRVNGAADP